MTVKISTTEECKRFAVNDPEGFLKAFETCEVIKDLFLKIVKDKEELDFCKCNDRLVFRALTIVGADEERMSLGALIWQEEVSRTEVRLHVRIARFASENRPLALEGCLKSLTPLKLRTFDCDLIEYDLLSSIALSVLLKYFPKSVNPLLPNLLYSITPSYTQNYLLS